MYLKTPGAGMKRKPLLLTIIIEGSGCALQTQFSVNYQSKIPIQLICLVSGFKYVVLGIKYSLVRRSLVGGRGG